MTRTKVTRMCGCEASRTLALFGGNDYVAVCPRADNNTMNITNGRTSQVFPLACPDCGEAGAIIVGRVRTEAL